MESYKTIKGEAESRFVEKKSEFISYIRHVGAEEEAIAFVGEIRAMHRKATHNCYAYILRENNTARHSDDGEPQGTAGVPIYDTLKKAGLTDVACVVTRYFGGIMLGAGGLVRAYGRGAGDAVSAAEIEEYHYADELKLSFLYPLYGRIKHLFPEFDLVIAEESFGENVEILIYIKENQTKDFEDKISDICCGNITIEKLRKKHFNFR